MRKPYLDRLEDGVLLFDGAMGTLLFARGVYLKKCFEETCLSSPQMVLDVHQDYIAAGAQAVETNTYGANPLKLAGFNLADKTEAINQAAVRLARQAGGEDIYVAGAVGPTGQILEPLGTLTRSEARRSFEAHIGALARAGVDLILLETFHDREEMKIALEAAAAVAPGIPVQAQFTLSKIHYAAKEVIRSETEAWARLLQESPGVQVAGMNLIGPSDALEALEILKRHVTKPLAVMPDSGFPKEVDGRQFYLTTPDYMAEYAKYFLDMGASVLGGCCGTTPDHIEKIARTVLSFDRGRKNLAAGPQVPQAEPKPEVPLADRSALGRDLAEGRWIATVELVPPLGWDLGPLLEKAKALAAAGVRYVNIPDGPRASARISALTTAIEISRHTALEPILHVATRDKNILGLQGDLFGGYAQGLRDVLLITGDPPKVGKYPNVTGVFDVDSIGLTRMVKGFNQGLDFGGEALPEVSSFVCGCGVNPAFPSPEMELDRAFRKAEAGTQYFITQPVWDQEVLEDFLTRLKPTGVPVILGVWPLASYRNALFLNNEVPGVSIPDAILERMKKHEDKEAARKDGIAIAREILRRMRPLIQGVQVSPPFGNVRTALEVLEP